MQHLLMLDLKDYLVLIAEYEATSPRRLARGASPPGAPGVQGMQIYRLGTRMAMVMSTYDAVYDPNVCASPPRPTR